MSDHFAQGVICGVLGLATGVAVVWFTALIITLMIKGYIDRQYAEKRHQLEVEFCKRHGIAPPPPPAWTRE